MKRLRNMTQKCGQSKTYDFTCETSEKVDNDCSKNQTGSERRCCGLGHRHLVAFWCFFYFAMLNSHIAVVSVAIVAMVNHTQVSNLHTANVSSVSCPLPEATENSTAKTRLDGPFAWDSQTQGQVLGLSVFGFITSMFFAGRIAEIFGAKRTLLFADFFVNLCAIVSPFAAWWNVNALIAIQILKGMAQGFIIPCIFVMMANWFPRSERGLLSSIAACGVPTGSLVTGVTMGRLCDIPSLGWPSAFYAMGAFNLCMSIIFACLFFEVPKSHPYMSKEELMYIVGDQENDMSLKRPPVPWKEIFTSIPVYALTIGKFGHFWALGHFVYMHPTFMGTVLHFSMTENGLLSSMLFLIMIAGSILSTLASNWLRKKDFVSVNNLRKGCSSISALGFSLCAVGVCLAGCDKTTHLIFFGIAIFFAGIGLCGTMIAGGDMSPKFSGSLTGSTSSVSSLANVIMPIMVGALTKHETLEEWHIVFYTDIAVVFFCGLVFQVFGSADIQAWNFTESAEPPTELQPQAKQPVSVNTPSSIHI